MEAENINLQQAVVELSLDAMPLREAAGVIDAPAWQA